MSSIVANSMRILNRDVSIAPLVTVRLLFGFMMCAGTIRFMHTGWLVAQTMDIGV